jgi:putative addiction module killer protein
MYEVERTEVFRRWLASLRDEVARSRILVSIDRVALGLADVKWVAQSVAEVRVHHGPGYRIYFTRRGRRVLLLLCGGDKSSQKRDIDKAVAMAEELRG